MIYKLQIKSNFIFEVIIIQAKDIAKKLFFQVLYFLKPDTSRKDFKTRAKFYFFH